MHWPAILELQDQLGLFLSWVILGFVHQVAHQIRSDQLLSRV